MVMCYLASITISFTAWQKVASPFQQFLPISQQPPFRIVILFLS